MTRAALALFCLFSAGCSKSAPGACTADSQCSPGRCCAEKCVDVQTSASHCGACFNACGAQNGAAKCSAGACSIGCSSGYGDCNLASQDGCETELTSATRDCGSCGNVCQSAHATNICERSQCLQTGCVSGFGDCNATRADGCEVDLTSSLAHCGACGRKCEVVEGVGACGQGTCLVAACNAGFGDCDLLAATGCETDLKVTAANCGTCGGACALGDKCKASKCVAPELLFYGGALSLQSTLATDVVSAFNIDTHAWSAVATAGLQTPGNRFAHAAVWDAEGNQMLVWGGFLTGNLPADSFVWSLDYSGGPDAGAPPTWKKLPTTGGPSANRGLMGWAWNKATRTLFVYGGTDADNNLVYDELWQFEAATLKWTQRTEPGSPGARYQPSMVWDSVRQKVVVGQGLDDNYSATSGFYTFDPAADGGGWSTLAATGAPSARAAAAFLGEAQPLEVWGGVDDLGDVSGELYRLDELDGGSQWTLLAPANAPAPRGYPTGASTAERRFAFGGFTVQGFNVVAQSEVWEVSEDAGWSLIADAGINFVHPGTVFSTAVARE